MNFILAAVFAGLGLIVGSFLNAAVYRLRIGQFKSIFCGRSFCTHCKETLKIRDLIPLVSYLLLRGRCRFCTKKISAHYFWIELTTALAFAATVLVINPINLGELIWSLLFVTIFIFLASFDFQFTEIPDEVSLPAIGLAFLSSFLPFTISPGRSLLGLCVGVGFFVGIIVLNEVARRKQWTESNWMGGGDVRLGALLGVLFGWQGFLIALFVASLSGSLAGGALLVSKQKKAGSPIPFGPFLAFGGFITLLYGKEIWNWYVQFLF